MKYSYEFKKNCIELYKQGKWADTPRGINKYYFRNYIRRWNNLVETHGIEVLKHKSHNNSFLGEDKYKYLYITFISIFYDTLIVYLLKPKFIKFA